jgi:hypothetical protein
MSVLAETLASDTRTYSTGTFYFPDAVGVSYGNRGVLNVSVQSQNVLDANATAGVFLVRQRADGKVIEEQIGSLAAARMVPSKQGVATTPQQINLAASLSVVPYGRIRLKIVVAGGPLDLKMALSTQDL